MLLLTCLIKATRPPEFLCAGLVEGWCFHWHSTVELKHRKSRGCGGVSYTESTIEAKGELKSLSSQSSPNLPPVCHPIPSKAPQNLGSSPGEAVRLWNKAEFGGRSGGKSISTTESQSGNTCCSQREAVGWGHYITETKSDLGHISSLTPHPMSQRISWAHTLLEGYIYTPNAQSA
mmetsp:Transcript_130763/g.226256  ORF Transcript_130763/g.226256 Transcript_130763/m.226256 type:complete len:176 (-) Transcript_130763:682-1209(-)